MVKQQQILVLTPTLSADTVAALRSHIYGCEACSEETLVPVKELLMRLIGKIQACRDEFISEDVSCPSCESPLDPDTRVKTQIGIGRAAYAKAGLQA